VSEITTEDDEIVGCLSEGCGGCLMWLAILWVIGICIEIVRYVWSSTGAWWDWLVGHVLGR